MGTIQSLNRVYTQIAGDGFRCRFNHAEAEFRRGEHFQTLALRYVQAQLVNAMQSAGCNAKHEAEQRLARWLLICCDRTNSTSFQLSQEFLAEMLGTRRTTVTMAAIVLKDAGLISYSRGRLTVLDVTGLKAKACECYRVVKDHLDDLKQFASKHIAQVEKIQERSAVHHAEVVSTQRSLSETYRAIDVPYKMRERQRSQASSRNTQC